MNYTDTQPLVQCALDAVMQPQEEITLNSRVFCITTRLNHTFLGGGSLGSDVHLFGCRQ